jgi:hypothetical protein
MSHAHSEIDVCPRCEHIDELGNRLTRPLRMLGNLHMRCDGCGLELIERPSWRTRPKKGRAHPRLNEPLAA